jgi:SAM-dependent methyltransferase
MPVGGQRALRKALLAVLPGHQGVPRRFLRTFVLASCLATVLAATPRLRRHTLGDRASSGGDADLPGLQWGVFPDCDFVRTFTPDRSLPSKSELVKTFLSSLRRAPGYRGNEVMQGIEVGALHDPRPVPAFCNMTYVDYVPQEELAKVYNKTGIQLPDIIDTAEHLEKVQSGVYDFYLSFHVFEHTRDFVASIVTSMRVLKPGGLLVFALPSMCGSFDQDRPLTSVQHFLDEFNNTQVLDANDRMHHKEWGFVRNRMHVLNKNPGLQLDRAAIDFDAAANVTMETNYPIHYHTFLPPQVLDALRAINGMFPHPLYDVIYTNHDLRQMYFVLRKLLPAPSARAA